MQSKQMFLSAILLAGFTLIHCNSQSGSDDLVSKTSALTTDDSQTDYGAASEGDLKKRVPPPPPPPASPPPVEAFTACASKTDGDACTFTNRERETEGTCRDVPNGETELACAPANQPPPPPPPPPTEEAFTGCVSKTDGDACTFKNREREIVGTCRSGPKEGSKLACAPANQPPPPPPPPTPLTEES